MIDTNKYKNETELQYLWRLGSAKDSGLLSLTWPDLADILNQNLNCNRTESAYRKKYTVLKQAKNELFVDNFVTSDTDEKIRELERAKIQFRDERNAWQKQNYLAARISSRLDILESELSSIGKTLYQSHPKHKIIKVGDSDLIVCLSDMHIGQSFKTVFGEFDTDIAQTRLTKYLNEVISIGKRHNAKKVWICLLGDQINGNIHFTSQIANSENIIEQIKLASEMICNFCVSLSNSFEQVMVIGASGNHSRLVYNKEFAVHDERLDNLITWIVEKMTAHIENISVLKRNLDSGIFDICVRGKTYIGVHGDFDQFSKNSVNNLVSMLGFFPYAVISAHNHFPAYSEYNGICMVQNGCLCGSGDDYTIEKRLSGYANQTVLVCDESGIECIYNVKLDNSHFKLGVK